MKKKLEITPNVEALFGTRDENLHLLEDGLNVSIDMLSDSVAIEGSAENVGRAEQIFLDFEHLRKAGHTFHNGDLGSILRVVLADKTASLRAMAESAPPVLLPLAKRRRRGRLHWLARLYGSGRT